MTPGLRACWAAAGLLIVCLAAEPAMAQKFGGVLKVQHWDSPASMSILEEATYSAVVPMMGVFNNLVIYDQHVAAEQPFRSSSRISPTAGRGARTARS